MEEDLIIEVWDMFKGYITEKNRVIAASHFVDFLIGKDVETSVLKALVGYDSYLDTGIEMATTDDVDEDDNEDYYDEDEE